MLGNEPVAMEPIPAPTLRAIEQHLYEVIRVRAARLIDKHNWPMPSLGAMLAGKATDLFRPAHGSAQGSAEVWFFPIPGMYGGFRLRWVAGGEGARLEAVSFCRVVSGSRQRHEITAQGSALVDSEMF